MMLKLLKTTRPKALLFFFTTALFLWVLSLHHSSYSYTTTGYPLFDLLQNLLFFNQGAINFFLLLITLLLSMGLNNLITERGVLKYNTILPAIILIFIVTPFSFSPVWPAVFISLFILNKLLSMYQKDSSYVEIYDAGLLIGLAVLFYPPSLFLFPVIYVANLTYSAFGWRNFIIPILGVLTPFFIVAMWLYCYGDLSFFLEHYYVSINLAKPVVLLNHSRLIWLIILSILLLLSFKEIIKWISLKSLRSRKSFIIVISYFFCAVLASFFVSSEENSIVLFSSIPIATLIGNYLLFANKWWWHEIFFLIFFLSVIYFHISESFLL